MNKIGVLYHPKIESAYTLAEKLQEFLASNGVSVWLCSAWDGEEARAHLDDTDLILTVGGDGTILRAAQAVVPALTPITGINLGKLGFMTELSADEAVDKLPALLAGEGWIDERAMLEAELSATDQEEEPSRVFNVLNDVVVARGALARVVLLYPEAKEFLLLPILPHLSSAYPMVLPSTAVVKLRMATTHQATLSIDGHINLPLSSGATITVKHNSNKTRFLRIHPEAFFYGSLEQRLKGK